MTTVADPADIRNWQRRSAGLTTSGRLKPHDPARLAAIGVRHVINLALDEHPEALAGEAGLLAKCGIAYTHIPVPFDAPARSHAAELRRVMESAQGPVHIHCIMNYRVSAFLYLLALESGDAADDARARMTEIWDPLASEDPMAQPWKTLLESAG